MENVATPRRPSHAPGTVRIARADDAPTIADVHIRAWRETFPHILSAKTLAELDHAEHTQMWVDHLKNPATATHVGEMDGVVVGFALAGRAYEGAPRNLELKMLYVLEQAKGTGLGQRLLDAAIADRPATLWVAVKNPRARAFYAKNGFMPDGVEKTIERWDNVVNLRVVR